MSWAVQLSKISEDVIGRLPLTSLTYHSHYMSQFELPQWLAGEERILSIDSSEIGWRTFCSSCRKTFRARDAIPIGETLWLFKHQAVLNTDEFLQMAASRKRRAALELVQNVSSFLPTIAEGAIGVVRLYEWGKY